MGPELADDLAPIVKIRTTLDSRRGAELVVHPRITARTCIKRIEESDIVTIATPFVLLKRVVTGTSACTEAVEGVTLSFVD